MTKPVDRFLKIECGGCKRNLPTKDWWRGWPPGEGADQTKVHWLYDPYAPYRGVYHSCGHWTGWTTKWDEKGNRPLPWP